MQIHLDPTTLDNVSNFLHELSELSEQYGVVLYNEAGLSLLTTLDGTSYGLRCSDYQPGYEAVVIES